MLGEGILKGLAETARNFAGSFVSPTGSRRFSTPRSASLPEATATFPSSSMTATTGKPACAASPARSARKSARRKCIYIDKSKDKKPDAIGKPQIYPARLRHRHLRLHELPDLRRSLPLRSDQDGHRFRAEHRRPLRRPAPRPQATRQVQRAITTRSTPPRPPKSTRASPPNAQPLPPRQKPPQPLPPPRPPPPSRSADAQAAPAARTRREARSQPGRTPRSSR